MGNRDHKRSPRQKMQDFMSTSRGQVIMNYAYNWGAAIVIMGALFKLTHMSGANVMLFIGMGTEVLIFFISAFDLSGVKRDDDEVPSVSPAAIPSGAFISGDAGVAPASGVQMPAGAVPVAGGPSVVVVQSGGGTVSPGVNVQSVPSGQPVMGPSVGATTITPEMEEATAAYLEQLKAMTDMLARCTTQAQNISKDTEQMNTLSQNLAGINAIYEMQLRSVSTQIGTIDQVHEQTRRMARQIEELNEVYARMLQAMTSSNK